MLTEVAEPAQRVSRTRLLQASAYAVPVVILALGAWSRRAMFDDAFINLRVVTEILHGHGPVFNPGQRVEAVTSPLWVAILALFGFFVPHHLEWMTILLTMAFSLVGVVLMMMGSRQLLPEDDRARVALPLGALVLVSLTPMWTYSAVGLENGLITLWLGGSLLLLGHWARTGRRLGLWAAVALGLGPVIRPEFAVYSLVFLAVPLVFERSSLGRKALVLLAGVSVPGAYEVFRMGYYGMVLPNSAVAKSPTGSRWALGWTYLLNTFDPYLLWLPFILLAGAVLVPLVRRLERSGGLTDRRILVVAAFVVGGLLNVLLVVKVGGDYMHARLLMPAISALIAPVAVMAWDRTRTAALVALAVVPWAVLTVGWLRSGGDTYSFFVTADHHPVNAVDFDVHLTGPGGIPREYARPGFYLGRTWLAPPTPGQPERVVALYGAGLMSFALGPNTRVQDLLGLGDPLDSHLRLVRRGLNSHEKPMPMPWLVARTYAPGAPYQASSFVTGPKQTESLFFGVLQLGRPDTPFAQRVAAARKALECGAIRDLQVSYQAPLTAHRFLSNVLHSFHRTFETFPAEPRDAVAAECG